MTAFAMSITELDQGFVAGFFEGEASFAIAELNAGQSYSCRVHVRVRDDDQDLIEWLVATTGLGRLHRVRAYRTSRPQIAWTIDTQDDCLELAQLLSRCGFHGRRATELEIWSAALRTWVTDHGALRRVRLRALKRQLDAARRFGCGNSNALRLPDRRRLRLGYISGIVAAEGSFILSSGRPSFAVHLRRDDRPLLGLLASRTGLGAIYDYTPAPPLNPSSLWTIAARAELRELLAVLREADLPGRKGTEMEVWAVAVDALTRGPRSRARQELQELAARRLRALRTYRPATRDLPKIQGRDVRSESLAALQAWSDETDGPLSCGAYAGWRRVHKRHPTRNTIATLFGGWQNALVAAGLEDRIARAPRPAGGDAARHARREQQRARVIAAVRRFEAEHERLPKAMEFFRGRMAGLVDSPSQGTVYRLFPGGWEAVLASL